MTRWRPNRPSAKRKRAVQRRQPAGRLAVFAPSPVLTVTIEAGPDRPEVHLHPGGQGFWVARMAANLGAEVVLCCPLGGEPGRVLWGLLEAEPLDRPSGRRRHAQRRLRPRPSQRTAGRGGERGQPTLTRHASDELYGIALSAGLDADATLLTGCQPDDLVDADLYRRLAERPRG